MVVRITKKKTHTLSLSRPAGAAGAEGTYSRPAVRAPSAARPSAPRNRRITDIFTRLSAMQEAIDKGALPKDDAARLLNRIFGEVLKVHKLEAEYQRLRQAGQLGPIAFFDPVEHTPLTTDDLKMLKQAARIQQEITRKLSKKAAA